MKKIEEVGSESIFVGESAEERQRKRELLAATRSENLQEIRRMTRRLKIEEIPSLSN